MEHFLLSLFRQRADLRAPATKKIVGLNEMSEAERKEGAKAASFRRAARRCEIERTLG